MSFIVTFLLVGLVVSYVAIGAYLFVTGASRNSKLRLIGALLMLIFGIALEIYGLNNWWLL